MCIVGNVDYNSFSRSDKSKSTVITAIEMNLVFTISNLSKAPINQSVPPFHHSLKEAS